MEKDLIKFSGLYISDFFVQLAPLPLVQGLLMENLKQRHNHITILDRYVDIIKMLPMIIWDQMNNRRVFFINFPKTM